MSLTKYLQAINGVDPGKIEIENVRSVLNTSRFNAKLLCELGVEDGVFEKRIGFICPNDGRILADFDYEEEIPASLSCHICENDGLEEFEFKTENLKTVEFYRLAK
jgi:hypothetical protein